MSLNNPKSGTSATSEFQMSGIPWVISDTISSTVVRYQFPKVSKDITVVNNNTTASERLRIGFTENGVNGVGENYYVLLNGGSSLTLDSRVKEIYLLRAGAADITVSVCANLTMIDSGMMPILTGSLDGTALWDGVG